MAIEPAEPDQPFATFQHEGQPQLKQSIVCMLDALGTKQQTNAQAEQLLESRTRHSAGRRPGTKVEGRPCSHGGSLTT